MSIKSNLILYKIILILFFSCQIFSANQLKLIPKDSLTGSNLILSNLNQVYDLKFDEFNEELNVTKYDAKKKNIKYLEQVIYLENTFDNGHLTLLLNSSGNYQISKPFSDYTLNTHIKSSNLNPKNFKSFSDSKLLLIDNDLYFNTDSMIKISDNCIDIVNLEDEYYFIEELNNLLYLTRLSNRVSIKVEYNPNTFLLKNNQYVVLISPYKQSTYVSIFDFDLNQLKSLWLDPYRKIKVLNNELILYLNNNGVIAYNLDNGNEKLIFPNSYVEDITVDSLYFYLLSNSFFKIYNKQYNQIFESKLDEPFSQVIKKEQITLFYKNKIHYNDIKNNNYWLIELILFEYILHIILAVFAISFLFLFSRFRQKNKMLKNVFDLPSAGVIINLDANGSLIDINKQARTLLNIPESVKKGRFFKSYIKNEGFENLVEVINKALNVKEDFSQKVTIVIKRNVYEYLCNVTIIRNFTGVFQGLILNAVDITEQLERKRLANWAQLAHDMQTNLSTIKLNIEELNITDNKNIQRQKKIKQQVNVLITRVRDIITVGRSYKVSKQEIYSETLFDSMLQEFDLESYNNIKFVFEFENFLMYCDSQKIVRGLRNAFENAIKYIKDQDNGQIILNAWKDSRYSYLSVKDNGLGMDDIVKRKMLDPFFTTSNNSEGTGIGSMIMQNVMQQHGGELIINSTRKKGTEVIFKIPNLR